MKGKVAFAELFDKVYDDERCEQPTNEQAHSKMIEDACMIALSRLNKVPEDADFLLIGDLVNQMTPSNFGASTLQHPIYRDVFSVCHISIIVNYFCIVNGSRNV